HAILRKRRRAFFRTTSQHVQLSSPLSQPRLLGLGHRFQNRRPLHRLADRRHYRIRRRTLVRTGLDTSAPTIWTRVRNRSGGRGGRLRHQSIAVETPAGHRESNECIVTPRHRKSRIQVPSRRRSPQRSPGKGIRRRVKPAPTSYYERLSRLTYSLAP